MNLKGIRRSGGGRKSALATIKGLDEAFIKVIANHTAGSPEIWCNRTNFAPIFREINRRA